MFGSLLDIFTIPGTKKTDNVSIESNQRDPDGLMIDRSNIVNNNIKDIEYFAKHCLVNSTFTELKFYIYKLI